MPTSYVELYLKKRRRGKDQSERSPGIQKRRSSKSSICSRGSRRSKNASGVKGATAHLASINLAPQKGKHNCPEGSPLIGAHRDVSQSPLWKFQSSKHESSLEIERPAAEGSQIPFAPFTFSGTWRNLPLESMRGESLRSMRGQPAGESLRSMQEESLTSTRIPSSPGSYPITIKSHPLPYSAILEAEGKELERGESHGKSGVTQLRRAQEKPPFDLEAQDSLGLSFPPPPQALFYPDLKTPTCPNLKKAPGAYLR